MEKLLPSKLTQCLCGVLVEARLEAGLTQERLGGRMNAGQSYVSRIENGERKLNVIELPEWCAALGLEMEEFVARYVRELQRAAGRQVTPRATRGRKMP